MRKHLSKCLIYNRKRDADQQVPYNYYKIDGATMAVCSMCQYSMPTSKKYYVDLLHRHYFKCSILRKYYLRTFRFIVDSVCCNCHYNNPGNALFQHYSHVCSMHRDQLLNKATYLLITLLYIDITYFIIY